MAWGLAEAVAVAAVSVPAGAVMFAAVMKFVPQRNGRAAAISTIPAVLSQTGSGVPVLNALGVCPEHRHLEETMQEIKASNETMTKEIKELSKEVNRMCGILKGHGNMGL